MLLFAGRLGGWLGYLPGNWVFRTRLVQLRTFWHTRAGISWSKGHRPCSQLHLGRNTQEGVNLDSALWRGYIWDLVILQHLGCSWVPIYNPEAGGSYRSEILSCSYTELMPLLLVVLKPTPFLFMLSQHPEWLVMFWRDQLDWEDVLFLNPEAQQCSSPCSQWGVQWLPTPSVACSSVPPGRTHFSVSIAFGWDALELLWLWFSKGVRL